MSMEKHRCKLCPRVFPNGRALGGHMRSHLATLPPPPKKKTEHPPQLGDRTECDSCSTHSENEPRPKKEENPVRCYGLRENPTKSVKASDPEFLDAGSVVQDRESETESTHKPTRRRSTKRPSQRIPGSLTNETESKKLKPEGVKSDSTTESAPVSSVSDPSQDEEVALCLMMLSRDVWVKDKSADQENNSAELKTRSTRRAGFKCLACKRRFRTNRALAGHTASSKECQQQEKCGQDQKIYECPFCYKVFGSGQALGGHKRSHLLGSSTNTNLASNHDHDGDHHHDHTDDNNASNVDKVGDATSLILDLNLPAPTEDDKDS